MAPSLTLGMATYEDFDGVYFTLEALHAYHPRAAYLVIDNAPAPCPRTKAVTLAVGGRYLHRPDLAGTSAPRDALFRLAQTDWVCCVDSHVLLEPGAVQALLDYAASHPDSKDLVQGPLVYDDGKGLWTHWRPTEPPGLWGTWDVDPRGRLIPDSDPPLAEHFQPFDIPLQGLGLFAMRRAAWPGFHPKFQGFGGEEGYIHEKVRQRGGRALCLPALRWRHRFRHMEHGAPPPPYRLAREDHTWNLLVGHRELGIEATAAIQKVFGKDLPPGTFDQLVANAEKIQPLGQPADRKRLKLLGVWYTNNSAPEKLLQASLGTIQRAVDETMHHDVLIGVSSWEPIPGNPFYHFTVCKPAARGHAAIIEQIRTLLTHFAAWPYDGIVFLEHDVLYPPAHFDRLGDALATGAPVASNLDYEGMNASGWLAVKERHEPLHQLALRRDTALANLARCEQECRDKGGTLLEPQGDRSDWVRLPFVGLTPAIHVNHEAGRFTSHGEVVFEPSSGGRIVHPFWGDYRTWWPHEARPAQPQQGGCNSCNKQPPAPAIFASVGEWFDRMKSVPSDFHEHMDTVRSLASQCETAVELSAWLKPALLALAAGKPKVLKSYCPGKKPEWDQLAQLVAGSTDFAAVQADSLQAEPIAHDLLFIDTRHTAERVYAELARWAPSCRRWIVLHTTVTFGERGDDGGAGVLPAVRRFLQEHPEWTVKFHHRNNHGLICLTRDRADKKELPPLWKQGWNVLKASWRAGDNVMKDYGPLAGTEAQEKRLALCTLCASRNGERCGECGCPIDKKTSQPTEMCPLGLWHQEK
jgi:hypothetical protein